MKEIDTKLVMKAVSDVLSTFGIYPQAIIENGVEKKRTEWQDGWNAAFMELSEKMDEVEKQFENGISDELALLLIADVGWLEDGKLFLNMNDTFWYASDTEEVSEEEVKEVARLFATYGYKGITYWVAKKRGYNQEIKQYMKSKLKKYEKWR